MLCYELQAYKSSYDLILDLYKITQNFKKEFKYQIWEKFSENWTELILNIFRANSFVKSRKENIFKARENVEKIRFLLRISNDLKILSTKKYADLNYQLEWISIQLVKWSGNSVNLK